MKINRMTRYAMLLLSVLGLTATQSCKEDIDMSNRYTFKEYTVASYLESHQDTYSEYYRLLDEVNVSKASNSTVRQLISARGHFTVFAPTNEAIQTYLDSLASKGLISAPNWDSFPNERTLDSIRKVIVFNSIIDGGDQNDAYQTSNFPEDKDGLGAEFELTNLNDRKLKLTYDKKNPDSMFINNTSLIDLKYRDILAINGFIHQVHSVIAPSNTTLGDKFKEYIEKGEGDFITIARMVQACGLLDTLSKEKDEVYENLMETGALKLGTNGKFDYYLPKHSSYGKFGYLPQHRKYGYTIFAEADEVYERELGKPAGEITLSDLEKFAAKYYPNAKVNGKYQDEDNALYQYITYHILPMRLPSDKLVIHYNESGYNYSTSTSYTVPTWEIYTTMGARRLLKLYQAGKAYSLNGSTNIYLNRFPELNNKREEAKSKEAYKELSCKPENEGIVIETKNEGVKDFDLINGLVYSIDGILAYDDNTQSNFQKQRLRFDAAALFPEWMNNDIRAMRNGADNYMCVAMPCSNDYNYCDGLEIMEGSQFYYLLGYGLGWQNWQGDEINVTGRYEMIFRLPPVPKEGTYEVRYAVQTNSGVRGMCQVYFGTDKNNLHAMGIPLDLRMGGQIRKTTAGNFESIVGWELDNNTDDDYNAEVDKKMRNNGFMKGPRHYAGTPGSTSYARNMEYLTRRIIVREYMYPDKTYYLKFKSVLDNEKLEFYMDYLELCAKEVYDNPNNPEDIW